MKKYLRYLGLALIALAVATCGKQTEDTQTIKVATSPGPYSIYGRSCPKIRTTRLYR